MKKTAAVLCAALLTLTACGGDDPAEPEAQETASAEETKAKESIKAGVLDNASVAGGVTLTDQQAECFADGLVDEVGVEQLQEYKILDASGEMADRTQPAKMSKADAEATAGVVTGCVDVKELIEQQIDAQAGTKLTEEQSKCISDAINEDDVEAGLAAQLQGAKENPFEESIGALMACVMGGGSGGGMELQ
jgi:hypothetical protein